MTPEQKRQLVLFLWPQYPHVLVTARECSGIPRDLDGGYPRICLHFPQGDQIPDLLLTDQGFEGTLLIAGRKHYARVPWSAVMCIIMGATYVVFPPCQLQVAIPIPEDAPREKHGLRVIPGGKA